MRVALKRSAEIFDEPDAHSRNANEDVLSAGRPDAKSKERGADIPADTSATGFLRIPAFSSLRRHVKAD